MVVMLLPPLVAVAVRVSGLDTIWPAVKVRVSIIFTSAVQAGRPAVEEMRPVPSSTEGIGAATDIKGQASMELPVSRVLLASRETPATKGRWAFRTVTAMGSRVAMATKGELVSEVASSHTACSREQMASRRSRWDSMLVLVLMATGVETPLIIDVLELNHSEFEVENVQQVVLDADIVEANGHDDDHGGNNGAEDDEHEAQNQHPDPAGHEDAAQSNNGDQKLQGNSGAIAPNKAQTCASGVIFSPQVKSMMEAARKEWTLSMQKAEDRVVLPSVDAKALQFDAQNDASRLSLAATDCPEFVPAAGDGAAKPLSPRSYVRSALDLGIVAWLSPTSRTSTGPRGSPTTPSSPGLGELPALHAISSPCSPVASRPGKSPSIGVTSTRTAVGSAMSGGHGADHLTTPRMHKESDASAPPDQTSPEAAGNEHLHRLGAWRSREHAYLRRLGLGPLAACLLLVRIPADLRGHPAAVFCRALRRDPTEVSSRLAVLGHCHHAAIARLYGAAASPDGSLFLAYELVPDAAPLSALLRGAAHNRAFTPLATWSARLRVAANACDALSYVHLQAGTVHNCLSSCTVLVCGDGARLRAKIAHFGAADLAGELPPDEDESQTASARHRRTRSRGRRMEGTRGYMAPEVITGIREEGKWG
ncbi:hypothetical protein ACQ4PT_005781 [Festuca glaucescens]